MWRAGAAKVAFTPPIGCSLTGYLLRSQKCARVEQQLYATALVITDGESCAIIVSLDVCGISRALSHHLYSDIMEAFPQLKREQIVLNSIHTHCGPAIEGILPTLFEYSPSEAEQIRSVTAHLRSAVLEAVSKSFKCLEPVYLSSGSTSVSFGRCRRVLNADRTRWIDFGEDPSGPADSRVPLLLLKRVSNLSPLSLVLGYACHPTTTTELCTALSTDFVGYARDSLEKALSADVLFLQLCGGDQNPQPRGGDQAGLVNAAIHGTALSKAILDLISLSSSSTAGSSLRPVSGPLSSSFLELDLETEPVDRSRLEQDLNESSVPNVCFSRRAKMALKELSCESSSLLRKSIPFPISALRFGSQFLLIALADEVVVRYALRLRKAIESYAESVNTEAPVVMVAGYCSEVSCYIPDAKMQAEGGYEPVESCVYYGLPSPLARDTELRVLSGVSAVLSSLGTRLKFQEDPITERPNDLTLKMDVASAAEFVQMVNAAERQIFYGFEHLPGISDSAIAGQILRAAQILREILNAPESQRTAVVIAGCGTSGRLAWQMALLLRHLHPKAASLNRVHYLMAAGDLALVVGSELAEDDMEVAAADLRRVLDSVHPERILYIGVTCGVSAPYVASHLSLLSSLPSATHSHAVLIGFNPPHLSRDVAIEGSKETFRSILMKCVVRSAAKGSTFALQMLTPIIGPEPLTGSSRMKGGSATLVLLHSILASAIDTTPPSFSSLYNIFTKFESGLGSVLKSAESGLAAAIDLAGATLRSGGRIRYAALDPLLDGVVALIDASEMVSTFGATVDTTRAFVADGWAQLYTHSVVTQSLDEYRIGLDQLTLHTRNGDLVFIIASERSASAVKSAVSHLIEQLKRCEAQVALLVLHQSTAFVDSFSSLPIRLLCSIHIIDEEIAPRLPSVALLALKSALNLLSTGAFVRLGKVMSNRMVDVSVSNNKLWFRALGLISQYGRCDLETARRCLLQAIYSRDNIENLLVVPLSASIALASKRHGGVVPRAILLARQKCTSISEANLMLLAEPQVSKILSAD